MANDTLQKCRHININYSEGVTFSWTPRPGGEPPYGGIQQGTTRPRGRSLRTVRFQSHGGDSRARIPVGTVVEGMAQGSGSRTRDGRAVHAWRAATPLHGRAETRGGRRLPLAWTLHGAHDAASGLSEKQDAAHGMDRRAGARPTQTEARSGARGIETRGGGRGRVRTAEIT